ncbi:Hypothetical predicted protein [Mytilus galloprovincialis]|uniref:C-type lectin domain-containing protein n=1 Tax=Mytilus galloprovincialis TaxID=29158 RepID=A0A8B6HC50_MYTGA|nr:Hypothetical predicted protein [Mytilus galloprovincialis]
MFLAPSSIAAKQLDTMFSDEKIWVGLRYRNGAEWIWDNGSNQPVIWGSTPILPQLCICVFVTGFMYDLDCYKLLGVVCQKDFLFPGICEVGWTNFGSNCFKTLRQEINGVDFGDARIICSMEGAHIMMPKSQPDAEQIVTGLGVRNSWGGVTDFDADHIYTWEDGTDISQLSLYFSDTEPNNRDLDYICAYIQNGHFFNAACTTSERVICQINATSTTVSTTKEPVSSTDSETKVMSEHLSTPLKVSTHLSSVVSKTSTENPETPTKTTIYTDSAMAQATDTQSNRITPTTISSLIGKSNCSKSSTNSCRCQKRTVANTTENQKMQTLKVTDYIWLNKCTLQPLIDSGMVDVANCPYECKCSSKGSTTSQEDMFACVRRP